MYLPLRRKFIFTALLVLAVFMVSFNIGCEPQPEAEPPGSPEEDTPPIPPEIAEGEDREPVLSVYKHEEDTVEEMNMEEYIAGVVAGEMEPDWPIEALAAQAIIARTFTLQKIAEEGGVPEKDAHASTDIEEFQAYSAEDVTDNVRKAVQLTKGEVACHDDQFIKAWFSAYAGPKTALADEGLGFEEGNPPYIYIVNNPGEEIVPSEEAFWTHSFDEEKVRSAVEEETGEEPGEIEEIEIEEVGPSGRAVTMLVNDTEVSAPDLRLAIGSEEMRSTLIEEEDIEVDEGEVTMGGEGFGHGVGVCQWGAKAKAEDGSSPEDIIDFFYKDIEIVTLWN